MITRHTWANGACCFTVDSEELAQWMREHPSQLAGQPISTKIANYGLGGTRAAARKTNGFAVQAEIDRAVGK